MPEQINEVHLSGTTSEGKSVVLQRFLLAGTEADFKPRLEGDVLVLTAKHMPFGWIMGVMSPLTRSEITATVAVETVGGSTWYRVDGLVTEWLGQRFAARGRSPGTSGAYTFSL